MNSKNYFIINCKKYIKDKIMDLELLKMVDEDWVNENPDSACELIHVLVELRKHDKEYIASLEEKLEFSKELNMLASAMIEIKSE